MEMDFTSCGMVASQQNRQSLTMGLWGHTTRVALHLYWSLATMLHLYSSTLTTYIPSCAAYSKKQFLWKKRFPHIAPLPPVDPRGRLPWHPRHAKPVVKPVLIPLRTQTMHFRPPVRPCLYKTWARWRSSSSPSSVGTSGTVPWWGALLLSPTLKRFLGGIWWGVPIQISGGVYFLKRKLRGSHLMAHTMSACTQS